MQKRAGERVEKRRVVPHNVHLAGEFQNTLFVRLLLFLYIVSLVFPETGTIEEREKIRLVNSYKL